MPKQNMHDNRRRLSNRFCFLFLVCVLVFSVPAYADIIYEPYDDFYEQHADECITDYYWKTYKVVSDSAVSVVRSPEDDTVLNEYKPGTFFSTNIRYQSGDKTWYYAPNFDHPEKAGWLSNTGIEQIYDSDCFMEDHASEIQGAAELKLKGLHEITFCAYPGGCQSDTKILGGTSDETLACEKSYTDPEGKRWGYCGYFYGPVNGWVCLDDPKLSNTETPMPLTISEVRGEHLKETDTDTAITMDTAEESTEEEDDTSKQESSSEKVESDLPDTSAEETKEPERKNSTVNPFMIVGILAGTTVLTAAVVLIVLLKKKK